LDAPLARILTAVAPDTIERVRRILVRHDLQIVTHLSEVKKVLAQGDVDVVFVGARFDDSRMFDLIELVRGEVEKNKIPIVAAIITPTSLSRDAIAGLSHAVKIFGASLFLNLNDFPDDVAGNARVRLIVETVILPAPVVEKVASIIPALTSSPQDAPQE
jgi:hypothetical protein